MLLGCVELILLQNFIQPKFVYLLCNPPYAPWPSMALLHQAGEKQALSAWGLHRVLRVARTIADFDGDDQTRSTHLAEALRYHRLPSES